MNKLPSTNKTVKSCHRENSKGKNIYICICHHSIAALVSKFLRAEPQGKWLPRINT